MTTKFDILALAVWGAVAFVLTGCEAGLERGEEASRGMDVVGRTPDITALAKAAELRASGPVDGISALVEEAASVRAASRVLASPEYAIGKWQMMRVEIRGYVRNVEVFKTDSNSTLVRSESNVVRESVRSGDEINHYTNPDRGMAFARSRVFESQGRIRDWIRDAEDTFRDGEEYSISPPETAHAPRSEDLESRSNEQGVTDNHGSYNDEIAESYNNWTDGTRPAGPSSWPAGRSSWSDEQSSPSSTPSVSSPPQTTYYLPDDSEASDDSDDSILDDSTPTDAPSSAGAKLTAGLNDP